MYLKPAQPRYRPRYAAFERRARARPQSRSGMAFWALSVRWIMAGNIPLAVSFAPPQQPRAIAAEAEIHDCFPPPRERSVGFSYTHVSHRRDEAETGGTVNGSI